MRNEGRVRGQRARAGLARALRAAPHSSFLIPVCMLALVACGSSEQKIPDIRLWTDNFAIRVSSVPMPPRALEKVRYKVVVLDKDTQQPIENGQGRIFATNRDRKSIDNGLEKGTEPGTYYTSLFFITAGDWAMGIQFRRDSTQTLQRSADWMQEVRAATPPGDTAR
jgi:hypothetical protein